MQVRRRVGIVLALAVAVACGPTAIDDPANPGSSGPAGQQDAGPAVSPSEGPVPQDGGAPQSNGSGRQQLLVVHDIHTDAVTADVLYARDVHAKNVRYTRLSFLSESQLPDAGHDNVHGDIADAREIHAHNVNVTSLDVGTLYVRSLHKD
jgi:hypothetical protein